MDSEPLPAVSFRPFPGLGNPHLQTFFGSLGWPRKPPSERQEVPLPDGDRLVLSTSTPGNWRPGHGTVVLAHGLCGSEDSTYLVRLAHALYQRGVRSVRMNARGHGPGEALARGMHHAGRSDDLKAVLSWLRERPDADRVALIGYSLGGNVVLKLAGEFGEDGPEWLEAVVAVAAPMDLAASADRLAEPRNRLYEARFLRRMRAMVRRRHRRCDLPEARLPRRLGFREFDDIYTAPHAGFEGAEDYYARCSSLHRVPAIRIRTWILLSEDDPIVVPSSLDSQPLPPEVRVTRADGGGHLGFLGHPRSGGWRWMDAAVLGYLESQGFPR